MKDKNTNKGQKMKGLAAEAGDFPDLFADAGVSNVSNGARSASDVYEALGATSGPPTPIPEPGNLPPPRPRSVGSRRHVTQTVVGGTIGGEGDEQSYACGGADARCNDAFSLRWR